MTGRGPKRPNSGRPEEGEVREEIRFYLELRARELEESGMPPEEAWQAAVEAFGDPKRIEYQVMRIEARTNRRQKVLTWVGSVGYDLRYAARFLVGNATFTVVAVGTLALGIGANTAIFSLADAALLRRPAVEDPGSLVAVYTTSRRGFPRSSTSYPDYIDYRDRTERIGDLAATASTTASLGDEERGARLVTVEVVTGNFFPLLGLRPQLGRLVQPADDAFLAGENVVVLSHGLWSDHFGADPEAIGRTIRLNGAPFEIVGVTPERYLGFVLGSGPDLWIPMQSRPLLQTAGSLVPATWESRGNRWMGRSIGRLAPGSTVDQARAELLALSESLRAEDPVARGPRSVTVDPLGRYLLPLGSEAALPQFVWLLVGVVALTLLLACASLANLLLARASTRAGEIGVRLAIGAGRRRLVRQLLVESLLLSAVGGAVGLFLALGLMRLLGGFELPGGVSISVLATQLDSRVLIVAAALAVMTTVLCGAAPALQATRPGVAQALRVGRDPDGHRRSGWLRRGLVTLQMAVCLVLLMGSGLFVRTLQNALNADLGIRAENLAVARFNLGLLDYTPAEGLAFSEELRRRVVSRPGALVAATSTLVPFQGGGFMGFFTEVEGYDPAPDEEMRIDAVYVSEGYFEALGIPLLAGRDFTQADGRTDTAPTAVVNRSMAERYWPAGRAVSGTLLMGGSRVEVVGVVDDVNWSGLDEEPTNFVFFPIGQTPGRTLGFLTLAVRTDGEAGGIVPTIREEARALEPDLSFVLSATMDELFGDLLMPQRMGAVLLSAFGLLALLLAVVGIAGVVSYTVREKRRSIGVRVALGARSSQVVGLVLRGLAWPVGLGLGLGLLVALLAKGSVEQFMYGVSAGDPSTYAVVVCMLGVVAVVATLIPARQAARVDPLRVLKAD